MEPAREPRRSRAARGPSSPYKGHVVRRNLALHYGLAGIGDDLALSDPWETLFERAVTERDDPEAGDLVPYWIFEPGREGGYKEVRDALGIKPGGRVVIVEGEGVRRLPDPENWTEYIYGLGAEVWSELRGGEAVLAEERAPWERAAYAC